MAISDPQSALPPTLDVASSPQIEAYVKAALAIQGYHFSEARIADVVQHFTRIEQQSRVVHDATIPTNSDRALIFKP